MISAKRIRAALMATTLLPLAALAAGPGVENTARPDAKPHTFGFGGPENSQFLLDGKPIQIRCGEMHPQRIPVEYWRHRVRMAKAMGMNTIAIYIFWNDLERADGSFDLKTGSRDIAGFLKICREEGMWVFFRPGPYICGEWDFGGIPPLLLKHRDLKVRTTKDSRFMEAQTRYLKVMADTARPFLVKNGGPILSTQLENEYGYWPDRDRDYMVWLRDFWTNEGFGALHISDSPRLLKDVVLPGVAVGLNEGKSAKDWDTANKANPGVPVFSCETYVGWIRHWGDGNWKPTDKTKLVQWFMDEGKSFSLYVIHGGTNFGFTAGANGNPGHGYQSDLTSYDYAAPINEQGRPTKEYDAYRKLIAENLPAGEKLPEIPAPIPAMEIAPFTPVRIAGLWDDLPAPFSAETPPHFEDFGQNQGVVVYATTLPAGPAAKFTCEHISDHGSISLGGKFLRTFGFRDKNTDAVEIPARDKPAKLEILVEGMGHINAHGGMRNDRKGLIGTPKLDGVELKGWSVHPMPLKDADIIAVKPHATPDARPGSHFRATVTLEGEPKDTFLDMSKYTQGVLWVNGHNLGRYWNIGPQLRLFCPASFLKKGSNTIDILDFEMSEARAIRGCTERNYDMKNKDTRNLDNVW